MQLLSPSGTFLGAVPPAAAEADAIHPALTDGDSSPEHWGQLRGPEQGARRSVRRQSPACDVPAPLFSLSDAWEAQATPGGRAVAAGMQDCWPRGDPGGPRKAAGYQQALRTLQRAAEGLSRAWFIFNRQLGGNRVPGMGARTRAP